VCTCVLNLGAFFCRPLQNNNVKWPSSLYFGEREVVVIMIFFVPNFLFQISLSLSVFSYCLDHSYWWFFMVLFRFRDILSSLFLPLYLVQIFLFKKVLFFQTTVRWKLDRYRALYNKRKYMTLFFYTRMGSSPERKICRIKYLKTSYWACVKQRTLPHRWY